MDIPFDKLGIPPALQKNLGPAAPAKIKLAVAKGLVPVTADVQLAICYVLTTDADKAIAEAARTTLQGLPLKTIQGAISPQTHPKILEFLAEYFPPDRKLDQDLFLHKRTNDRTAKIIAGRADDGMCELISNNHEKLLMTPDIVVVLHANPLCGDATIEKIKSFLRMEGQGVPAMPAERPFRGGGSASSGASPAPSKATPTGTARGALSGDLKLFTEDVDDPKTQTTSKKSILPAPKVVAPENATALETLAAFQLAKNLGEFKFDFQDELNEFNWDLIREDLEELPEEKKKTMEQYIYELPVGKKIKLAFGGNKQARSILIRDRNRVVAVAVLKSGKCTDPEIASFASNRNLDGEVAREIARSSEWTRKYPVRAALCANNKTPVPTVMEFMHSLTKRDLANLARNRNVSAVIFKRADTLMREKFGGK